MGQIDNIGDKNFTKLDLLVTIIGYAEKNKGH